MNAMPDDDSQQLADSVTRYLRDHHGFPRHRKLVADAHAAAAAHRADWRAFGEMGWLGIAAGADHGGSGLGLAATAPVLDALGARLVLLPYASAGLAVIALLQDAASEEQRAAWLPPVVAGERMVAFAHEEAGMRYRWQAVETRASRDGDGFLLQGAKQAVAAGAWADGWIVSARAEDGGLSLFHVPASQAGVTITPWTAVDGMPLADLAFAQVRLPASACIGGHGTGGVHLEHALDVLLAASCAEAVGTMAALLAQTVDYAKVRTQFGVPIGSFQVIQHKLVDMFTQVQLSRPLAALALSTVERHERQPAVLSAAKAQVSAACRFVGETAIQVHGGIGMTEECEASHLFRRLVALDKRMGDRHHHLGLLVEALQDGRPTVFA